MTDAKQETAPEQTEVAHSLSHVMPLSVLFGIFAALVLLTILTVIAAQFSFGAWEVWVSLGIATIKAALVAIYFMHLRYDRPFNAVVFLSAIVFVALFLALTLMDLHS
ncbi:MAG: cytochrome C oxidase subunit IV family protein [Pseudomonadota bacterium]